MTRSLPWWLGVVAMLSGESFAAEKSGPAGLELLGIAPEPTALFEPFPLKNRLSLRLVLRNDTGKTLSFETAKAFFLDAEGGVLGTSTMGPAEFARRRSLSSETAFGNGRLAFEISGLTGMAVTGIQADSSNRLALVGYGSQEGQAFTTGFLVRMLSTGQTDPDFGDGKPRFIPNLRAAVAVVLDASDRMVVLGTASDLGVLRMGVIRYTAAGEADPEFNGGHVRMLHFENPSIPRAVAVDGLGRVLVGGSAQGRVAMARLLPSGVPDPEFGIEGRIEFDVPDTTMEQVTAIAADAQNRVVIAGLGLSGGTTRFLVARFHTSGILDPSFSGVGRRVFRPSLDSGDSSATAIRITPSGRILVGGWAEVDGARRFALARFNTNGTYDLNFANDGTVVRATGGGSSTLVAMTQDSLQRIVAVGFNVENEVRKFTVARFTGVGDLDPSFSGDGFLRMGGFVEDSNFASGAGVAILPDEKILVGGWAVEAEEATRHVALARLNPNGTSDGSTFIPEGAKFTLNLSDFPFLDDIEEQDFGGFDPKKTPRRINFQLKFTELASPLFVSGIDVVTYHRNPESYRFPLQQPHKGRWRVSHSHEIGDHHEGSSSQRFAYDVSVIDTENGNTSLDSGCDLDALLAAYADRLEEGETYTEADFNECRLAWGEPVLAIADGEVIGASNNRPENFPVGVEAPGGGNAVVLQHADGVVSFYAHMVPGSVTNAAGQPYKPGDRVKQGDRLGSLGNSGHSSGPHLHFHLSESYSPGEWGEGVPAQFNNVFFKTVPGVGSDLRQLRTGIPSGTVIDWIDPQPPTLTVGAALGPGAVVKIGDHDNLGTALRVKLPVTITATASPGGDDLADGGDAIEDVYRFTLTESGLVTALLSFSMGSDLDMMLYDAVLKPIQPWSAKTSDSPETFTAHLGPGTYFLMVSRADDVVQPSSVNYQLQITFAARPFDSSFGLTAEPRGAELSVSWPVIANVSLETLETLDGRAGWRSVTTPVFEDKGRWVLRINTREPYRFFRLRQR